MEHWENACESQTSYIAVSDSTTADSQQYERSPLGVRVARLPPRSRSGCWTCRNRKVKCDERRPKCRQCIRLDHECDYSPKLVFKDETLKVVDKYVEPLMTGGSWASELEQQQVSPIELDSLPPFTHLTTDEDWQQKATYRPPGTYYVVANSGSFADSPEYKISTTIESRSQPPSALFDQKANNNNVSVDNATLILGSFEGPPRKTSIDIVSTSSHHRLPAPVHISNASYTVVESSSFNQGSDVRTAHAVEQPETTLMHYWRLFVRRQLFYLCASADTLSTTTSDIVEEASKSYLPLRHALLALCSFSFAVKQDLQTVQALEYYTKAIDALKEAHTEEDLLSDGLFLTHYILLVYEISATDRFWYHHMESLKSIIARRRAAIRHEPFASIVLSIYNMDATGLISCSGEGSMILDYALRNSIPTTDDLRNGAPLLPNGCPIGSDWIVLEPLFDLLRDLLILWARLGQTSRHIRQEIEEDDRTRALSHANALEFSAAMAAHWTVQVSRIRDTLRRQWHTQSAPLQFSNLNEQQTLLDKTRQTHQQAAILYHSGLIYSYTSMWPYQSGSLNTQGNDFNELQQSITEILNVTRDLVERGDLQQRNAVLALLLVGSASRSQNQRHTALELLKRFEEAELGCNTRATRMLLEAVMRRKDDQKASGMHEHVDWILMARELGWQHLVNFGF